MDTNIYIACFRQVVTFSPKVIIACLRQVVANAPKVIIACLRQVVAFAPKVIKMRRLRRRTREGWRYGRMGGRRERARGEYRFMKPMK